MLDRKYMLFETVAAAGSMRAAARSLYMTQPALSQQITLLEQQVGVPLFARSPHGVRLTKAGEQLYKEVQVLQAAGSAALERVRSAEHELSGTLRLGGGKNQRQLCLPEVCRAFAQRYPHIRQSFTTLPAREMPRAIMAGEIDVVEFWASPMLRSTGCLWQRGKTYDAALLVPRSHRLAAYERISCAELDGEEVVVNACGHFDCSDAIRNELIAASAHITLVDASDDEAMENYTFGNQLALSPHPYPFGDSYARVIPLDISAKIVSGFAYSPNANAETLLFIKLVHEMFEA